jgi:hypothetical protein
VARKTHHFLFAPERPERRSARFVLAAMLTQFRNPTPFTLCALVAAIGGLLGGTTAVHGLHQKQYGPSHPPPLFGQQPDTSGDADNSINGCEGCSERELGYRWASLAEVRSPANCPNDSWGFRRGCLDYTNGD